MFNPTQIEVRQFFFNAYQKGQNKDNLTDLEKITYSLILEHPEYHFVLQNPNKYSEYQWYPESGETNPFLHLSMHLTVIEQLSIDQPAGICDLFNKMCHHKSNQHDAYHELIDCLGEMIWQSQKNNTPPDSAIYFNCINHKLGIGVST